MIRDARRGRAARDRPALVYKWRNTPPTEADGVSEKLGSATQAASSARFFVLVTSSGMPGPIVVATVPLRM